MGAEAIRGCRKVSGEHHASEIPIFFHSSEIKRCPLYGILQQLLLGNRLGIVLIAYPCAKVPVVSLQPA